MDEIKDSKGKVIKPGDFVSYLGGSNSWAKEGDILKVLEVGNYDDNLFIQLPDQGRTTVKGRSTEKLALTKQEKKQHELTWVLADLSTVYQRASSLEAERLQLLYKARMLKAEIFALRKDDNA
jgi:hypothetical protein